MPCKHCHKPKVKKRLFNVGNKYRNSYGTYICAYFDSGNKNTDTRYILVNMISGNRWTSPKTLAQLNCDESGFHQVK